MAEHIRLVPDLPLREVIAYFRGMYQERNSLMLHFNPRALFSYTFHGAGKIHRGIDENKPGKVIAGIAQTIAGAIGCNNDLHGGISLDEAMSSKYPIYGCSYCGEMPCGCRRDVRRPPSKPAKPDPVQLEWGLNRWAKHNDDVYGPSNRKRTIEDAILRLYGEVNEVSDRISGCGENLEDSPAKVIAKLRREITDILARTLAIANLRDINPEKAVIALFGNGCPACHKNPCACPLIVNVGDEVRSYGSVCFTTSDPAGISAGR